MEIVKNGWEEELVEVVCSHCNSILKCTLEEKENDTCPVCGCLLSDYSKDSIDTGPSENLQCENCGYDFLATSYDGIGVYGGYYTHCPKCGAALYFSDGIEVNTENLALEHFSCLSEDAKEVDFPEIKNWIKIGVNRLKNNPDEYIWYICSGDSFVLVTRDDSEFFVVWTNDYKDVWVKG